MHVPSCCFFISNENLGENYPAGLDASNQLPGLLRRTLRVGKIPSHKSFQFVRTPSWYLISGHDVRLYLHCQSGSHRTFAQKMRCCSLRSDERLPVAQCRVRAVRPGCHNRRHLCPRKGSPLRVPREKAPPCWVSSSLVHDQVRQKRREALKTALYARGLGPNHLISCFVHAKLLQYCLTLQFYEPTRLLCTWDSPGKNTEVGCHFLLQGILPTWGLNQHLCVSHVGRWVLSH